MKDRLIEVLPLLAAPALVCFFLDLSFVTFAVMSAIGVALYFTLKGVIIGVGLVVRSAADGISVRRRSAHLRKGV